MVEFLVASVLLLSGAFLLYLAGSVRQPIFGVLAGFFVLVFGVLLLGSGFQFGTGHSDIYQYSSTPTNTSFYNSTGGFTGSSIENVVIVSSVTQTNSFSSDTGVLNQGLSLFFMFMGLLISYLSFVELTRPKNFIGNGGDLNFQGEEE